jgi:hypothetical protein
MSKTSHTEFCWEVSWKNKKGRKKYNEEDRRKGREKYLMNLRKIAYGGLNGWQNISSGGDLVSVVSEPLVLLPKLPKCYLVMSHLWKKHVTKSMSQ